MSHAPVTRVIRQDDWAADLGIVRGPGSCTPVIWPGMGAVARSMHVILLGPGSHMPRLRHPSEAVYYVADGHVRLTDCDRGEHWDLAAGSMLHAEPGATYCMAAVTGSSRILGGPCPPDPALYRPGLADAESRARAAGAIRVFHRDNPTLMVPQISADARLIVWLGAGARTANMNYVVLQPGESNVPHVHEESEDTIVILEGHGSVRDYTAGVRLKFAPGDTAHIAPGVRHAVSADLGEMVVSVGGPCPADLGLLRALGLDVDALLADQARRSS